MKRFFLFAAAAVVTSFFSSCADIGGADPLDSATPQQGPSLFIRETP